jgi:hypothetical protein
MKKITAICLSVLSSVFLNAQTPQQPVNTCGTGMPSQQWEEWLSKAVEKFKANQAAGKSQTAVTEIPVIVHVIYYNEGLNTYPNVDSNQVISQFPILNDDFAGQGYGVNDIPSYFNSLLANTGIRFCRAARDPSEVALVPKGIHRVSAFASNWTNPNTATLNLQAYLNNVIIPATIWDPTKYLNIWISDKPANYPLNGFATYPPGTNLTGVFGGGINVGTSNNDGVWIYTKAFGTGSNTAAPYNKGRTAVHEIGHWLGLRHIWGDGNCLSDYCNDTPTQKAAHYGCDTVPTNPVNACGVGSAPYGEMPNNFMDMTQDACKNMFTNDQNIRMQVALSQSTLRYQLGTHNKCSPLTGTNTSSAVASFTMLSEQCIGSPFTPFNNSSGFPYPQYVWSASPAANISPNTSVSHPAITVNGPGSYTLTLVATNSLSSSTHTFVFTASGTCATLPLCLDSIKMIKNVDTLKVYKAPSGTQTCTGGGYLTGTSCYHDIEIAQYYPPSSYTSTPNPQINSAIVLFDSVGTRGALGTQISCKVWGGTAGFGPSTFIGQKSDSLGKIMATPRVVSVGYLGKPYVAPLPATRKIIPFVFNFPQPLMPNTNAGPNGFYISITLPSNNPGDSVCVMSNTKNNSAVDSTAWYLTTSLSWKPYRTTRSAKVQLAIIPQITCGPIQGLRDELSYFNSNINIIPNPNNGLFNLIFTFDRSQDITVKVYNYLGQQISSNVLENVLTSVIDMNLSDKPDGIYMTEITNGRYKVVKKVVVTH